MQKWSSVRVGFLDVGFRRQKALHRIDVGGLDSPVQRGATESTCLVDEAVRSPAQVTKLLGRSKVLLAPFVGRGQAVSRAIKHPQGHHVERAPTGT
jgi:hypothetical protein